MNEPWRIDAAWRDVGEAMFQIGGMLSDITTGRFGLKTCRAHHLRAQCLLADAGYHVGLLTESDVRPFDGTPRRVD